MRRTQKLRWLWAVLIGTLAAGVTLVGYLNVSDPLPPYTAEEVTVLVDQLNYAAAIESPHLSLGKDTRAQNLALFEMVERGIALSQDQSADYRKLYQGILRDNQWYLRRFDRSLTVVHDHAMQQRNNVGGHGIQGDHDHHDFSAASNYASVRRALARLESASDASGAFAKVMHGAIAYKDLTDILLHMATAPQTKSTSYAGATPGDELDQLFDTMMRHFKAAQFLPINSPEYVVEMHSALAAYDGLTLAVQGRINGSLDRWQRVALGRWTGWQSFGPNVDLTSPSAPLARSKKTGSME